jgi:hypothetical protein
VADPSPRLICCALCVLCSLQPLQQRVNELDSQKKFLLGQNRSLEKLKADVFALMQAMTGELKPNANGQDSAPSTPKAGGGAGGAAADSKSVGLPRAKGSVVALGSPSGASGAGKRPSMRATVIMALAAARLRKMGSEHAFYGLVSRGGPGELAFITPNELVSQNDSTERNGGTRCTALLLHCCM